MNISYVKERAFKKKKPLISTPMRCSPWVEVRDSFQGLRVHEQLVEHVDDVDEARTLGAVMQPALQHQLVDGGGTVHGRR